MTTVATRRYFVAPDGNDTPSLWFGTDTEDAPRLVAQETPSNRPADLPAPLFDLVTTVLSPTDDDLDRLAQVLQRVNVEVGQIKDLPDAAAFRLIARAVLAELATGVLA